MQWASIIDMELDACPDGKLIYQFTDSHKNITLQIKIRLRQGHEFLHFKKMCVVFELMLSVSCCRCQCFVFSFKGRLPDGTTVATPVVPDGSKIQIDTFSKISSFFAVTCPGVHQSLWNHQKSIQHQILRISRYPDRFWGVLGSISIEKLRFCSKILTYHLLRKPIGKFWPNSVTPQLWSLENNSKSRKSGLKGR